MVIILFSLLSFTNNSVYAQANFKQLMAITDGVYAVYRDKPQIVAIWTDTLIKKGFLLDRLQWQTILPGGSDYSDVFRFSDIKDDGIDEHLEVVIAAYSDKERPYSISVSLITDNLNQYLGWSTDLKKNARYRMNIKTPFSESFRTDIENNNRYDILIERPNTRGTIQGASGEIIEIPIDKYKITINKSIYRNQ